MSERKERGIVDKITSIWERDEEKLDPIKEAGFIEHELSVSGRRHLILKESKDRDERLMLAGWQFGDDRRREKAYASDDIGLDVHRAKHIDKVQAKAKGNAWTKEDLDEYYKQCDTVFENLLGKAQDEALMAFFEEGQVKHKPVVVVRGAKEQTKLVLEEKI